MIHACRGGRGWRSCIWVPSLGALDSFREELIERVKGTQRGGEFEAADEDGKLAMILDGACKERGVGMAIRKMWKKRFV